MLINSLINCSNHKRQKGEIAMWLKCFPTFGAIKLIKLCNTLTFVALCDFDDSIIRFGQFVRLKRLTLLDRSSKIIQFRIFQLAN